MEQPELIINLLEAFGFEHVDARDREIRCARDYDGNKSSIRIKLRDNDRLYVQDYAKSKSCDIFTYIIQEKNVTFKDVISYVNKELGIVNFGDIRKKKDVFGGFYKKFYKFRQNEPQKTYDESVLEQYHMAYSKRFHKDNISYFSQKLFGIRYDVDTQRIIIPIYNPVGELIGAKGRANCDIEPDSGEEKYLYLIPCRASETLFGYSVNYQNMTDNCVFVVEAEKSVMQAHGYGMCTFVGLGGNAIHDNQCKLLVELLPKKIVFLLDEGLDMDIIIRNIETLQSFTRMLDIDIGFWNYESSTVKKSKASPTDLGKEKLLHIIENEITYVR